MLFFAVGLAKYALVLGFDSIVFLLTVAKTFQLAIEHRRLGLREGVGGMLLRDGESFVYCPLSPY